MRPRSWLQNRSRIINIIDFSQYISLTTVPAVTNHPDHFLYATQGHESQREFGKTGELYYTYSIYPSSHGQLHGTVDLFHHGEFPYVYH